ncbi:MAG: dihydrolipoyl dehydrogenase [Desulfovibrionaceae bacterium]
MTCLTVIGAGPGGYTAAFAAARAGIDVTLIESQSLGGTCLNSGCIPTKTLKASADALETALRLSEFGISTQGIPRIDPVAVLARKNTVCATLRDGLEKTCTRLGVKLLYGKGTILSAQCVDVTCADGNTCRVTGDDILIATGSRVLELPDLPFDHHTIISSDDALNADQIPPRVLIVGGGVIGCEMAFIYRAFGADVTVVEGQNRLLPLPSVDADMSTLIQREMKKRRIRCECNRTLAHVQVQEGKARAVLAASPFLRDPSPAQQQEVPVEADVVLVTVGRVPNSHGLGLEAAGIATDARGWISVNDYLETSVPHIYAIGDILGPPKVMLAHVAAMEGLCVVDALSGKGRRPMDYSAVPSGIFTSPEIGCVGLSEKQALEQGYTVRCASLQVRALGKAQAMGELPGVFKIISDAATGKILGAHLAGAHATDLIAEATLAITMGATVHDITQTIHAHPTLAEGFYETALLVP